MLKPEHGDLITNAAPGIVGIHDTVLQSLECHRPYQHDDGSVESIFFGLENFSGTESGWEKVPIIFGKVHPKTPYQKNPAKALEESKGRIAGNMKDVFISSSGTPLLRGTTVFTDPEAEFKHKERKLALSTGFISGKRDGKLTGVVIPDHILVFEHDRTHRPQDSLSMWLNGLEEKMGDAETNLKGIFADFLAELKTLIVPVKTEPVMPVIPESQGVNMVSNMTETKIAELEKTVGEQAELIKNMSTELDAFKAAEDQRKAAELERKWQMVKNSIPPGLTATPELETTARNEWTIEPSEFLIKNGIQKKAEETSPEGVQFVKNGTTTQADDSEYLKFINGED